MVSYFDQIYIKLSQNGCSYHETMFVCAFFLEIWIDWSTRWVGVPGSVRVYLMRSITTLMDLRHGNRNSMQGFRIGPKI